MSAYDIVIDGNRSGQVKCWDNRLHNYVVGDSVPDLDGRSAYSIALREGGFVQVHNNIFIGIDETPLKDAIADKYGDWHTLESIKMFYNSSSDLFSVESLRRLLE